MFIGVWVFILFLTNIEVYRGDDLFESFYVMQGGHLNLNPGVDLMKNDQIVWSYESHRLTQMYQGEIYNNYDERFNGRVELNQTTGVLTIPDIRINESGLFEAFIVLNREISRRKYKVDVYSPVSLVTEHQSTGTSQASNSSIQPIEINPPNEDCQDYCGVTEALIRLVLSGLVGIATVIFIFEHQRFCSVQKRDVSSGC